MFWSVSVSTCRLKRVLATYLISHKSIHSGKTPSPSLVSVKWQYEWWETRVSSFSRIVGLGMEKTAAADFQPTEPFPAPSATPFASRSPGMRTGSRFHKSRHQPQTGVVRFAISSTMSMRVPDVGRDGNRWTDFSPVAFACQLPRDRALKTRCGSTTCHSRNVCHTSPELAQVGPPLVYGITTHVSHSLL